MKCILLLVVVIAACSANVLRDPPQGYKEGDRYFYFPKGDDGTLHLVDAEELPDLEFIEEYTRNPANNAYFLYTRDNPTTPQRLTLFANSVATSNFKPAPTIFLAHGWGGNGRDSFNTLLIDAFLQDDDVNVIVLDWSRLASRSYTTAKAGTAAVGRGVMEMMHWLAYGGFGVSYGRFHLVGFSLGAHLIGNAGRLTKGGVRRVTGLDPAGPLWSFDSNRLSRRDAAYVEVIHTDNNFLGYAGRLGHADFYPNGGSNMPGCTLFSNCSHFRAVQYMAATVKYNHLLANECASMSESNNNRCRGSLNPMGNSDRNKYRWGIFRVNTGRTYPY